VERPLRPVSIPLASIRSVHVLGPGALRGSVPLVLAATFGLSWACGPRSAELTEEGVRIERNAAGPVDLPFSGIRSARPLGRAETRGWRRTAGVGLGRLAYGRFRSDALGPFRLYAWRRGPLLLLETEEGKVVPSPDDPDRFLEELRARLAR